MPHRTCREINIHHAYVEGATTLAVTASLSASMDDNVGTTMDIENPEQSPTWYLIHMKGLLNLDVVFVLCGGQLWFGTMFVKTTRQRTTTPWSMVLQTVYTGQPPHPPHVNLRDTTEVGWYHRMEHIDGS